MAEAIRNNLMDAGCAEDSAALVERLYTAGRLDDALHQLRVIRCRVDRLDYLIRQTEKEMKTTTERR